MTTANVWLVFSGKQYEGNFYESVQGVYADEGSAVAMALILNTNANEPGKSFRVEAFPVIDDSQDSSKGAK